MKKLLLTLATIWASVQLSASPVYPFPVTVTQSDGTELTIIGHGDENFHYTTTTDGVLLVREGRDYFVGRIDEATGQLTATRQLAHEAIVRSVAEQRLAALQNHDLFLTQATTALRQNMPRREPIAQTGTLFPHTGTPKAIVILAEFTDTVFSLPHPRAAFDQYLNSLKAPEDYGGGETSNASSVKHYFKTMSGGAFEPQFDVYGPVKLPYELKHYGGTKADGAGENMSALLQDACTLMNDSLDFSQYDADGDGNVDLVFVIYAGYSESISGNSPECIWPKSGTVSISATFDEKKVVRYGVSSELNGYPGAFRAAPMKRINGIGVFCHEFSHCMGLPDLYPTDKAAKDHNQSMEYWSLMDLGEYLGNGYTPTEYTAWERECFGWTEIPELEDASQMLSIKPLSQGGSAYRITNTYDATGHEYYLLENIQQTGFNYNMKGHGLVVTHVNYDAAAFSLSGNKVNNVKGKPRMTVVPADGLLFSNIYVDGKQTTTSDFYAQCAGDPFPGTSDVTEVTEDSDLPNLALWTPATVDAEAARHAPSATGDALQRLCYVLSNITEDEDGIITLNKGVTDIRSITTRDSRPEGSIYTLDGRYAGEDMQRLGKGIYIRDGKKLIRR